MNIDMFVALLASKINKCKCENMPDEVDIMMNESEVAGMALATAVPIPVDEALTGSSAEALQGVNAGALPVPMDTTATSLKTPVTVCETLMAEMMKKITESETLM
jgi:hypothetical protein